MESTAKLHQPENIVNALIGHDEGLSKHYRRYTSEQLRDSYKVIEPWLCIEAPVSYAELQGETKQALSEQNAVIVSLVKDMQSQKEFFEQKNQDISFKLKNYEEILRKTREEVASLRVFTSVQDIVLEFDKITREYGGIPPVLMDYFKDFPENPEDSKKIYKKLANILEQEYLKNLSDSEGG